MAVTSPQTFGTDYVLSKLVDYFNSLSAAQRTIGQSDLPFYNIKVAESPAGDTIITVGDDTADLPGALYVGEATYTWVGPRGTPTTATPEHFFEVSKFINGGGGGGAVTTRVDYGMYVGTLSAPQTFPELPQDGSNFYMLRLDGEGDAGWDGDNLRLEIDYSDYTIELTRSEPFEVPFRADDGIHINMQFNIVSGAGSAMIQLIQYNEAEGPDGPSAISVWPNRAVSVGPGYPAEGQTELVEFDAPYVPEPYDMVSSYRSTLKSSTDYGVGSSVTSSYNNGAIAIRESGAGKTKFYYNPNTSGFPGLQNAGIGSGGYGAWLYTSADGVFTLQSSDDSSSVSIATSRYTGREMEVINDLVTSSYITVACIEVAEDGGNPTLVVSHSGQRTIDIYEGVIGNDDQEWNLVASIPGREGTTAQTGQVMGMSPDCRNIVAVDETGVTYLYHLTGVNWASGEYTSTDITTLFDAGDSGDTAHPSRLAFSRNGDMCAAYYSYYSDVTNLDVNKMEIFSNIELGLGATSINSITNSNEFKNLISCDKANNPNGMNVGFMATTQMRNQRMVGVWMCQDLLTDGMWPADEAIDNSTVLKFDLPGGISEYTQGATCIAPYKLTSDGFEILVGCEDNSQVVYMEYYT